MVNVAKSPISADATIRERARAEAAGDDKFWRNFLYFFELTVPSSATFGAKFNSMLFPLVLNPQSIQMSEPFSLAVTPTVEGGLFLEENGIIARTIRIEGHTGFSPLPNRSQVAPTDFIESSRFSFNLRGDWSPLALSGQRHFQFLQDRVFRIYGELKRNPVTSRGTVLAFHNVKDDEHFLVAPIRFDMRRDLRSRFTYRYSIELLVYDKAERRTIREASEDRELVRRLKDTTQQVRGAIDSILAWLNEARQFAEDLESKVNGVLRLLDQVSLVVNAAVDFAEGVADSILSPIRTTIDVIKNLEEAIIRLVNLPGRIKDIVAATFRGAKDALHVLASQKTIYQTPARARLAKVNALSELGTSVSASALAAAEANTPSTLRAFGRLGTAPLPGDRLRASVSRGTPSAPTFRSAVEYVVTSTDTLQSLAARFLGSAAQWRAIAILNGLEPPYISESAFPKTVKAGDKILIPSEQAPPSTDPNDGILGVDPELPLAEKLLGEDFLLGPVEGTRDQYDFAVDLTETGATDIKTVKGIPNLGQALRTRMHTEQGTVSLYRGLGHRRLVGIGVAAVDDEIVRLRLREAIEADPRIARVSRIQFDLTAGADTVDADIVAQVRGFHEPITVQARVG